MNQLFTVKLSGKTYEHRDVFRVLDYHWSADETAWVKHHVPEWETKLALANTINGRWPNIRATISCESSKLSGS